MLTHSLGSTTYFTTPSPFPFWIDSLYHHAVLTRNSENVMDSEKVQWGASFLSLVRVT